MFQHRKSLWFLVVPYLLFFAALPWVNHVQPRVAGITLLTFWMFVGVILTPVAVWLASRGDPVRRRAGKEKSR
jgi:hypothetical protein